MAKENTQPVFRIVPEDNAYKEDLITRLDQLKELVESGELKRLAFVYSTVDDLYVHAHDREFAAIASVYLARIF